MMMMVDVSMKLFPSQKDLVGLKLAIPDQETECPIPQEPIQTAVFESLPRPFCKAHPEHKALTLGCSHTFHAMALVYHWSRSRNVLCPICRAGPQGQRLVMSRLPRDWRYSLSAKVKREKQKDREEAELENLRAATLLSQEAMTRTVVSFIIRIEIQALTTGCQLMSWSLNTALTPSNGCVEFEASEEELQTIPRFTEGTVMRFIPFAHSDALMSVMITPSEWFVVGGGMMMMRTPSFGVEFFDDNGDDNNNNNDDGSSRRGGGGNGKKFKRISLKMQEEEFICLIAEAYFAANSDRL
jgi:hypothetical protein